jgi:hypothetical protein
MAENILVRNADRPVFNPMSRFAGDLRLGPMPLAVDSIRARNRRLAPRIRRAAPGCRSDCCRGHRHIPISPFHRTWHYWE